WRYDAAGEKAPLGSELSVSLTPEQYPALQPLATSLTALFEGTGGLPSDAAPGALSLGDLDLGARGSRSSAAARLSIGIAPRLEIGARLPLGRADRLVYRQRLEGGTLGVNPDRTGNQAILDAIGWGEVGESVFLPLA